MFYYLCLFLFEDTLAEKQNVQQDEKQGADTKSHIAFSEALGSNTHQKEEGETEEDGPWLMLNQIVAGLAGKLGVDLAQEDCSGGGGAGLHTVKGEECCVLIHGEDAAADNAQIEIAGDSAENTDDGKGNDEAGCEECVKVDSGDGCDNHNVKHKA